MGNARAFNVFVSLLVGCVCVCVLLRGVVCCGMCGLTCGMATSVTTTGDDDGDDESARHKKRYQRRPVCVWRCAALFLVSRAGVGWWGVQMLEAFRKGWCAVFVREGML